MNTTDWLQECPNFKEGASIVSTATSLHKVTQGSKGTVLRKDPDAPGFYLVRWDIQKGFTTSVPWDSIAKED